MGNGPTKAFSSTGFGETRRTVDSAISRRPIRRLFRPLLFPSLTVNCASFSRNCSFHYGVDLERFCSQVYHYTSSHRFRGFAIVSHVAGKFS